MLRQPASHRRGFTMVELAVTLAVFALLAAVAMPSMSDWFRNTRARNAAEALQAGLHKARAEAMRRNETITFWLVSLTDSKLMDDSCALSSTAASWVVSREDPSSKCSSDNDAYTAPAIVDKRPAGENASFRVSALNAGGEAATCVRFNGFGRVVDANALPADDCRPAKNIRTIDVSDGSAARRLRIVVTDGGSIRMCDRDVAASDPRACP